MYNQRFGFEDESLDYDAESELAPQIIETIGTGKAPDASEDFDEFAALEARIEDLLVLRASIQEASGMCQGYALEAQRLLPEFDEKRPLGYYSLAPSATRYAVVLEEISHGIWTLIVLGIGAVIALIVKFMKWLGKGKEEDAQEVAKNAAESFADAKKKLVEVEGLLARARGSVNGKALYWKEAAYREHFSFDSLIKAHFFTSPHEQRMAEFLQTKDPFFHDLVSHGPYAQEMASLSEVFKNLQVILRQRLNALQAVNKLDLSSDSLTDDAANIKTLTTLSLPIQVGYQGHPHTLQEIKASVDLANRTVAAEKPESTLSFDHLFVSMNQALNQSRIDESLRDMVLITPLLDKMREDLQHLETKAGSYTTDGKNGRHSTMVGTDLRHSIFVLGIDLGLVSGLISELMAYRQRLLYLTLNATSFAEAVAVKLARDVTLEDGKSLEQWQQVAEQLLEARKELKLIAG